MAEPTSWTTSLPLPDLLARLRAEQEDGWRAGQGRAAEEYLLRFPDLSAQPDFALVLILGEVLLRRWRGEEPTAEEYQQRFPPLADRLAQQFLLEEALGASFDSGESLGDGLDTEGDSAECAEPAPHRLPGYEILGELGRGGMGVVYKAVQVALHRPVALKMLRHGADCRAQRDRFRQEAELTARLRHPGIARLYESGEHNGQLYLAMELVNGQPLTRLQEGRPLEPARAARLLLQLAETVQAAHEQGVLHRDLKPGNVLVTGDDSARIIDFGLAQSLDGGSAEPSDLRGTPCYMAPEQAAWVSTRRREHGLGREADVYGLGAVLYEMLTGAPPFTGVSGPAVLVRILYEDPLPPSRRGLLIPPDLESICLKCLHKGPANRYPSARALADVLARFLHGPSPGQAQSARVC
jgi:serine/threonine protein kinase